MYVAEGVQTVKYLKKELDPMKRPRSLSASQSRSRMRSLHTKGVATERVRLPNGDVVVLRSKPTRRDPSSSKSSFKPIEGKGRAIDWIYDPHNSSRKVHVTLEKDGLYYVWVRETSFGPSTWTYAFPTKAKALKQMRMTAGYATKRVYGRLVPAKRDPSRRTTRVRRDPHVPEVLSRRTAGGMERGGANPYNRKHPYEIVSLSPKKGGGFLKKRYSVARARDAHEAATEFFRLREEDRASGAYRRTYVILDHTKKRGKLSPTITYEELLARARAGKRDPSRRRPRAAASKGRRR